MIKISEDKIENLSEYTEKMLHYGGKLMSCLEELKEDEGEEEPMMGMRGGYRGRSGGMRGGMREEYDDTYSYPRGGNRGTGMGMRGGRY